MEAITVFGETFESGSAAFYPHPEKSEVSSQIVSFNIETLIAAHLVPVQWSQPIKSNAFKA